MPTFKKNPYEYRRRLPHLQRTGKPVFVTFHALGFRILPTIARDIAMECCRYVHGRKAFLHAAIIMPKHVHLVLNALRNETGIEYTLTEILKAIKSVSARRINKALMWTGPVWEEEPFDHVLRSDEKLEQVCEYVRLNPVRRGLVQRSEEYRWLFLNPEPFV